MILSALDLGMLSVEEGILFCADGAAWSAWAPPPMGGPRGGRAAEEGAPLEEGLPPRFEEEQDGAEDGGDEGQQDKGSSGAGGGG